MRRIFPLVVILATAMLAGCATDPPVNNGSVTPPPSPSTSTPIATSSATPTATAYAAHVIPDQTLNGSTAYLAVDTGPRIYARGSVVVSRTGVPLEYRVAANDEEPAVAARFGIPDATLFDLNQVRRGCAGATNDTDSLFAGDIVNLDPHTVLAVGTQHGRVCHLSVVEQLPPQESPARALVSP